MFFPEIKVMLFTVYRVSLIFQKRFFRGCLTKVTYTRGATKDDFCGQFFRIFEIIIFCFVVAICDLVHTVEAMYGLP